MDARPSLVVPMTAVAVGAPPVASHSGSGIAVPMQGPAAASAPPPIHVHMYQSLPFVKVPPGSMLPDARCLPLFFDSVGLRHFFSGNQRGTLYIVVQLLEPVLPRFPVGALDAGVSLRCFRDAPQGKTEAEAELFEFGGSKVIDADQLCVRINLRVTGPGKETATAHSLYYFHVCVTYRGIVLGAQSPRMRILSKPRRLLMTGMPSTWDVDNIRQHWPSLRSLSPESTVPGNPDTGAVAVVPLPASGRVPPGFEAPLHRALVASMRAQVPMPGGGPSASTQVVVLDFASAARCGHFVDEHLSQVQKEGIWWCLAPRRPRPDPTESHYAALCIAGLKMAPTLSARINTTSRALQWVLADVANPGTTRGEAELLAAVCAAHQQANSLGQASAPPPPPPADMRGADPYRAAEPFALPVPQPIAVAPSGSYGPMPPQQAAAAAAASMQQRMAMNWADYHAFFMSAALPAMMPPSAPLPTFVLPRTQVPGLPPPPVATRNSSSFATPTTTVLEDFRPADSMAAAQMNFLSSFVTVPFATSNSLPDTWPQRSAWQMQIPASSLAVAPASASPTSQEAVSLPGRRSAFSSVHMSDEAGADAPPKRRRVDAYMS